MIWDRKNIYNKSQSKNSRKFFLSACLIVKNESYYILELIAYHRIVGFDFFYIYDNDSSDGLKELLAPLTSEGICCVIDWPRALCPHNPQVSAYFHCWQNFGKETEWLATIDADEFVVPLTSDSVASVLRDHFSARDAVLCNWRTFGSAGHRVQNSQLCMERFHRASLPNFPANNNVKSIFRPEEIEILVVHNHYIKTDNVSLSDGSDFKTPREQSTRFPIYGHLRINHYYCKSKVEFLSKRLKGLADHPIDTDYSLRGLHAFDEHDRNECLDQVIFKFLYETKAEIDRLRQLIAIGRRR